MSGLIPRPFIDELLNRIDIVEFIDSYVPLKKRGNSHLACCPFHNEKTPSFNVVSRKQFYHCFGCGASGNVISFAMNYLHLGFSDAIDTLASRIGMEVPRENISGKQQSNTSLYPFMEQIAKFYQQALRTHDNIAIQYLKQRGVSGEMARLYKLGYAPSGWHALDGQFKRSQKELITTGMLVVKEDGKTYDRYRHRIMFPIHDRQGRLIGFGGRAIDTDQKPKYLNSPETVLFQKGRELYGLYQAIQQNPKPESIIVVEGYLDVIALAQHGITHAVATLGTATSSYHIQLLNKYTKQIIFCFDGDAAGRQAAWRALETALPHMGADLDIRFVFLPADQDPDSLVREMGASAFLECVKQALPLHQFFMNTLYQGDNVNDIAGKNHLVHAAKPYLAKLSESPYKELLIQEMARITRLEPHRIYRLLRDKETPAVATSPEKKPIKRSPLKIAIALLLQSPDIYERCKDKIPETLLDTARHRLIKALWQQIGKEPQINTAQLIEAWRNTTLFEPLTQLAVWDHQVPEHALENEFIDTLFFLAKQHRESDIQQLMQKAHGTGLSESERLRLQSLLKQRHQMIFDKN